MINEKRVYAYDFRKNRVPSTQKGEEPSYWRDLGTIEAYYEANMDLCSVDPSFNLYNRSWPLRTTDFGDPPAKFVFDWHDRKGMAVDSIVSQGTIISGSAVKNCVVGRNVRIHSYSQIEGSVIMDWAEVRRAVKFAGPLSTNRMSSPQEPRLDTISNKTVNDTLSPRPVLW